MESDNKTMTGLTRGFKERCPACGEGRLYTKYLKVRPVCEHCGHDLAQYRADDAPPYFTILIVGHIVVGPSTSSGPGRWSGCWSPPCRRFWAPRSCSCPGSRAR